jgi:hypothetical protein
VVVELGGVSLSKFRNPYRGLTAALAWLAPVLAGCSALPSMPSMPSWFSSAGANANASATVTPAALPADIDCPPVQVRTGASTLTSSANPAEPSALNLRYQVTIGTTARECRMGPNNTIALKIGMQGRIILGPEGAPGTIDVPLRYAVVRDTIDSKVITTKLDHIAVTVPPNDGNVLFSHVTEGMEFPMPKGAEMDYYVIYIGFDPAGAAPEVQKKPKPRQKPAAKNRQS